ncbi:MAG: ChaN family lipoprotein [Bacteroidetes bacterium]|nr:ChaN family lipoprotein [Fibrella sp.]
MKYWLPLLWLLSAFRADKPAYLFYTQSLKPTSYDALLKQAADADVVLFGELHNNPICHWLELRLAKDLYAKKKTQLVLGAEMFETDNQSALTAYASGQTTSEEFAKQARLWPNYDTDYRPLTDFTREQKIPFVATNAPRKYASLVARQGLAALDTLPADLKKQLAPLPVTVDLTLPGYKNMLTMMGGDNAHGGNPHGGTTDQAANFARAQAIKDATMAHFILQNWSAGKTVLHLNGAYHSNNFEGISWYLKQQNPALKILTVSSVELEDIMKPEKESKDLANYVLAIPADMTKTY